MARGGERRDAALIGVAFAAGGIALLAWYYLSRKKGEAPKCPAGQHYDEGAKKCVPDSGAVVEPCACVGMVAYSTGAVPQRVCFTADRPNFSDIGGAAFALRFCDPKVGYARLYSDVGFTNYLRDVTPADAVDAGTLGRLVLIPTGARSIILPPPPPSGTCAAQGGTCTGLDVCVDQGKTCVNSTDCSRCCCVAGTPLRRGARETLGMRNYAPLSLTEPLD